jgi:hypothetical protein
MGSTQHASVLRHQLSIGATQERAPAAPEAAEELATAAPKAAEAWATAADEAAEEPVTAVLKAAEERGKGGGGRSKFTHAAHSATQGEICVLLLAVTLCTAWGASCAACSHCLLHGEQIVLRAVIVYCMASKFCCLPLLCTAWRASCTACRHSMPNCGNTHRLSRAIKLHSLCDAAAPLQHLPNVVCFVLHHLSITSLADGCGDCVWHTVCKCDAQTLTAGLTSHAEIELACAMFWCVYT